MRIDAHQHYWSPSHGDYGWLTPTPALAPICRDFAPVDLHPQLDAAGIVATVLVQAAPSEAETHRLLAIAAEPAHRVAGVVGWCDLLAADAAPHIAALAQDPGLKGLRPMLHDLPDPNWMLDARLRPAWAAMRAHGLSLDALVRPQHLVPLLELAQREPGLAVVIDHGAKPAIATRAFQPWARQIAQLARATPVLCKLSGLVTEAAPGWRPADLQPYIEHLLAEFGPTRLMWGSDWPVVNLAGGYHVWFDTSQRLLQGLSADARAQIFGGTATAFYRLDRRRLTGWP